MVDAACFLLARHLVRPTPHLQRLRKIMVTRGSSDRLGYPRRIDAPPAPDPAALLLCVSDALRLGTPPAGARMRIRPPPVSAGAAQNKDGKRKDALDEPAEHKHEA